VRSATKEIIGGTNAFLPEIGFSHKHRIYYVALGALRYWGNPRT
jgi:hypothetical protein